MTEEAHLKSSTTMRLFLTLFLIGISYVAAFFFMWTKSVNFIDAPSIHEAVKWASLNKIALPLTVTFSDKSQWNNALADGWSKPEEWGVWSNSSKARIVLPLPSNANGLAICLKISVGALMIHNNYTWRISVLANDKPVTTSKEYMGAGPYEVITAPFTPKGHYLDIVINGPSPRTPMSTGLSNDPRLLSFNIHSLQITHTCHSDMKS